MLKVSAPISGEFTVQAELDPMSMFMWSEWARVTEGDFKDTKMGTQGPFGGPPLALITYKGENLGFYAVNPKQFTEAMLASIEPKLKELINGSSSLGESEIPA